MAAADYGTSGAALVELSRDTRFHTAFDHLAIGAAITDTGGRWLRVNRALTELFGYGETDLVGRTFQSLTHPEDLPENMVQVRRALAGEIDRCRLEKRFLHASGNILWVQLTASVVRDTAGNARYFVAQYEDLTARKAAEARLNESEQRFRALTEQSWELVCILDADGTIRYANPGFTRVLGYEADEVMGHPAFEFVHEDDLPRIRQLLASLLERPHGVIDAEYRVRTKTGSSCLVTGIAQNLLDDSSVRGIVVNAQDITERHRAREALRQSEERFQHIVNNVPGMVYQWAYRPDWSGGYTYVSEGARSLFGVAPEEALRDPERLLGLIAPDDREVLRAHAREAAARLLPFRWEGRVILPSGEERIIQIAAHDHRQLDGTVLSDGLVMDITGQRELERQLRQAQKMEAVGRLAGGIAHDFNNLLTVISSYTSMALEAATPASEIGKELTEVRIAAERAASLTRQLLAFSRQQVLQPQRLDISRTVTEVAGMLRRVIGEDIALQLELATTVWPVLADPGQLTQVLMNLSLNARDAMPNGGRLRLTTANATIVRHDDRERPGLKPGDYVEIRVEDTGTGIDPAALPHIFEPFYTTKGLGHGTGLGLATVYGIVKQSDGFVYVDSTPGSGTRFTVLLPRTEGSMDPELNALPSQPRRGTEVVLLVEDDQAVRGAVRLMLSRLGYHVLEADGAAAALRVAAEADARGTRVQLIVTDVVMPEQNGRALGERLAAFWPSVPVLYISGYPDDEILRRGLRESTAAFLEKPFTIEQLGRAVRETLDNPARGSR